MRRRVFILIMAPMIVLGVMAIWSYEAIFNAAAFPISESFDIKIPSDATLALVTGKLDSNSLKNPRAFKFLAERMNYSDGRIKEGLYEINPTFSLIEVIRHLRSGNQKPVDVVINSIRTIEDLSGKLTRNLKLDSIAFIQCLESRDIDRDTFMTRFIPNTYSVYWNISCEDLIARMDSETKAFWNKNNRLEKAEAIGLSPKEVYILASIVEQESTLDSEKPTIASVYLNRLERGMKLQADPTVVFANQDFSIRRVLNVHLALDSPYNTYKYTGLPPGPICMPSISSIDAVLNPDKSGYIFFCAKPGYQNGHAFARNLREHNNNARTYRNWLQLEGIR